MKPIPFHLPSGGLWRHLLGQMSFGSFWVEDVTAKHHEMVFHFHFLEIYYDIITVDPWKWTRNLNITQLRRKILFQTFISGFHINCPRCSSWGKTKTTGEMSVHEQYCPDGRLLSAQLNNNCSMEQGPPRWVWYSRWLLKCISLVFPGFRKQDLDTSLTITITFTFTTTTLPELTIIFRQWKILGIPKKVRERHPPTKHQFSRG